MTIFRVKHSRENPYVMVNRMSVQDTSISLEAKGLWIFLLSRPDNWTIYVKELVKTFELSKGKINKIINELGRAGYLARKQTRSLSASGKPQKFSSYEYWIFETPQSQEEIQKMFTELDFTAPCFTGPQNRPLLNRELNKPSPKGDLEKKQIPPQPPLNREEAPARAALDVCDAFGKFVKLEPKDYQNLCEQHGTELVKEIIEEINDYLSSTGKKPYKDYAATIRNWARRRKSQRQATSTPRSSRSSIVGQINGQSFEEVAHINKYVLSQAVQVCKTHNLPHPVELRGNILYHTGSGDSISLTLQTETFKEILAKWLDLKIN